MVKMFFELFVFVLEVVVIFIFEDKFDFDLGDVYGDVVVGDRFDGVILVLGVNL